MNSDLGEAIRSVILLTGILWVLGFLKTKISSEGVSAPWIIALLCGFPRRNCLIDPESASYQIGALCFPIVAIGVRVARIYGVFDWMVHEAGISIGPRSLELLFQLAAMAACLVLSPLVLRLILSKQRR